MINSKNEYIYYTLSKEPELKVTRQFNLEMSKKEFYQKHYTNKQWVTGGAKNEITPYRYHNWVDKDEILFHVEGEKCAERLIKEGFCATTSAGGSKGWKDYLSKFYKDKDVIILPDNDESGRTYAKQVALSISSFAKSVKIVELPYLTETGEDIYDWLLKVHTKADLLELCEKSAYWVSSNKSDKIEINLEEDDDKQAPFSDYNIFIEDRLNNPRKDILSGELMTLIDKVWQPAISRFDVLASYAFDSKIIKKSRLKEHLARLAEKKPPELLVDIPEWDKVDRLRQISNALSISNCTQEDFYQLLCDWGAKLFLRIKNPKIQNRIIIFHGTQGIGKDYLIDSIVDGFGQFATNITIANNDRDTLAAVGSLIVGKISEFDRTAHKEVSFLKDLITREETFIRLPYDRSAKKRPVRYSLIASVNVSDILRDHTGNRRFVIFNVEHIERSYPTDQSPQILAQFKYLSEAGFKASEDSEEVMKKYIMSQTPDDPTEAILEAFDARILNMEQRDGKKEFILPEVEPILSDLAKSYGYKMNALLNVLKTKRRSRRASSRTFYFREHS